jgi:5'-methylthioadenosine phosphorylase
MERAQAAVPRTPFALLSGSAQWGIPFPAGAGEPGVRVLERKLTFETPWGSSANWQLLELDGTMTVDGRSRLVLNVFSHGWPLDEIDHSAHRKVAWILAEAGVRKVLADSTCGSLDRFLVERDFIIPADVIDFTQTAYSLAGGRFRYVLYGNQLFCPSMAETLEAVARELWPAPGRVFGHGFKVVVAHNWGPRYKSTAEGRAFERLGAHAMNQSIGPEATAVREIGACFASASYIVARHVDVAPPKDDLDKVHSDLAVVASRISLRAVARTQLGAQCGCAGLRKERPEGYAINAQGEP